MKDRSKGSEYKCSQVFGYKGAAEKVHEEDIISALKFDQEGKHLALGDKAGRIIVFKADSSKKKQDKFSYYTEFQAYNREFDPLNSSDVQEDILGLSWMKPQGNYHKILTMNSKYIKLWKTSERNQKKMICPPHKQLTIPKFQILDNSVNTTLQKTFPNKLQLDLIGMSVTKNEEYIICSDPVKSLLWNIQKSTNPYLICDLQKDKAIDDVKQNVSCLKCHPSSDSIFTYGTNRGAIIFSDTRISCTFLSFSESYNPITLRPQGQKQKGNLFTQMIYSYSDMCFLNNQRQIAARDYLSVKIWDIGKPDKPILSIPVQQSLKSKLCDIFENDSIFDKFNLSISKDSNTLLTGNYNNSFHAIDVNDSSNTQYEVSYKKQTITKPMIASKPVPITKMDYARKILATDFHPTTNSLAVASLNCFLIYSM